MLARFFSGFRQKKQAYELYGQLVTQARTPAFYTDLLVEDSLDGRFDMILLHLFLLDRRLEAEENRFEALRRNLQEALIADMDRSLREMGVGDMSVGKEVKKMGAAWFGRLKAYTEAQRSDEPEAALAAAIAKNLFKKDEAMNARPMSQYVMRAAEKLAGQSVEDMVSSGIRFPEIPGAAREAS